MARDDRMARIWSPGTNVGPFAIANGGFSEQELAPSVALQTAQDRDIRQWTVTRVVGRMQLNTATNAEAQVYVGIRVANENEVPGNLTPATAQTADWMYWTGVYVTTIGAGSVPAQELEIDNRSQRKSRGMESTLILYVYNAGPDTVYMWWSGRTLLLVP